MFGFLKKKIKESIESITKSIEKKPEKTTDSIEETSSVPIESKSMISEEHPIHIETEPSIPEKEFAPEREEVMEPMVEKEGFFEKVAKKITRKITETTIKEDDISSTIDNLKMGLLENDVALDVAEKICSDVKQSLIGKSLKKSRIEEIIKESLKKSITEILSQEENDLVEFIKSHQKPVLLLFVGFNGAGKTTTLARICHYLKRNNLQCVLAAGDSFRAASIEQLQIHGDRLGVKVIRHDYGADSAAVVFDAMKYATAHNIDVVLADTAGRSHTNINLMDELQKVCRVNSPAMKILVLDSLTGNDIIHQSEKFDSAVGIDAVVFTKVDVYEKGGAILSSAHTINKPILFLGIGQGYEDLKKFESDKIVDQLFAY